jgi:hypothetical protein
VIVGQLHQARSVPIVVSTKNDQALIEGGDYDEDYDPQPDNIELYFGRTSEAERLIPFPTLGTAFYDFCHFARDLQHFFFRYRAGAN